MLLFRILKGQKSWSIRKPLPSYQPGDGSQKTQEPNFRHTVLLHDAEELDNDLGGRPDQDLALASLLGIVDRIQAIVKDASLDHIGGAMRFSLCEWTMRYLRASLVSLQEP